MGKRRKIRLEKNLKRIISDIIRHELELPDVDLLSVTDVELTPDMQKATVYVSHIKAEKTDPTMKRLRRKEKTIRSVLTPKVDMKNIPELRFREDKSIKEAAKINDIVQDLQKEREQRDSG